MYRKRAVHAAPGTNTLTFICGLPSRCEVLVTVALVVTPCCRISRRFRSLDRAAEDAVTPNACKRETVREAQSLRAHVELRGANNACRNRW